MEEEVDSLRGLFLLLEGGGLAWRSYIYIYKYIYEELLIHIQGGSDKSGIFFFLLSNDTAQLKII
jgi:hypothetical protein